MFTDQQKIGAMLSAIGLFFGFLGVLLFLDRGLLALGNILLVSGIFLILGFNKTLNFFGQRKKIRGTILFFLGIIVLLATRWTFVGMLVELFGFVNLFGDAFPIIISILRKLPIIGNILNHPIVNKVLQKADSGNELPF
ncbi:hypothetical protein DICPUDRAFT_74542 [Dictyostelium purpureum]|uniref:Uncharacterized protein n=1 Tax=Dictyostelium purpureum TaxID=5786 RepID=F0Z818_DICPU|nr:uncharacterized protein DICPUDRAFT_74542 [Dictyostelium purpureum]EGC39913.1 hypothetical protein DICPUDRAFT_74542 [Dictyostelium purpureum]|eukprot:XP_003283542.1 hypothetical protein DICPUDRAFT_74542 [Dictyostelium purpureum]